MKKINYILKQGENINIEFKECKDNVPKNLYETICAFLNRYGGEILLGVNDNKEIIGLKNVEKIKTEIVTTLNNPQKINPSVYLSMQEITIKNKKILYIYVPQSSQVHLCNGKIFDRNEEGDLDITNKNSLITQLYLNKQKEYSENTIYPFCKISDLRKDLIDKARKLAIIRDNNHPWKNLTNLELLKSSKLYMKDYSTGKKGFTLACILLFGKDETILSVLPHYKTDLILRKINLDRYDDRDDIRTNLIDSYEKIINFSEKHLPDPFYLENSQRISLRNKIMREVASNILIHREFINAYPTKIIFEKDKIYCENANKPYFRNSTSLKDFTPYPKNPTIARIFKEIGFADELGSGVRNLIKYVKIYSGKKPQFIEDDIFKIIIPLKKEQKTVEKTVEKVLEEIKKNPKISAQNLAQKVGSKLVEKVGSKLVETQIKILLLIEENPRITKLEIASTLKLSTTAIDKNILKLKELNLLKRIGPDKGGHWKIK